MIDPRPPPSADQPSKTPPPSYYLKSSRHEPSIMKDLITAIAALAVTCSAAVLPLLPSQPDKKISNIDQTGCVDVCQDKGFKNCMEANYTVATCTKFPEGISAARSMKLPNARWKCALYRYAPSETSDFCRRLTHSQRARLPRARTVHLQHLLLPWGQLSRLHRHRAMECLHVLARGY
ncbi:hypothetical protein CB0940_03154 [Cercospora beticola]|uniref:Uncharacterized protein n=1 Tax=Cercospora beticola TaxID=122368 RepID=A0A2G5I5L7_CERBT|nr:hypothetical protein CB0940_03154 [Cercospora beticola]PIB00116.1 hypothetical protein CB0940_03154 [Cercospora beticola]